jgi:HlyD family secretion protein
MDLPRKPRSIARRYGGWTAAFIVFVAVVLIAARARAAAPAVERSTLTIDTVRRGEMLLALNARGVLVPEHMRIIAAVTSGRVDVLPIRPGTLVTPAALVVELSNSDVELQVLQSEQQLTQAQERITQLRTSLRQQRLGQQSSLAQVRTLLGDATRQNEAMIFLNKDRLAAPHEVAAAREKVAELTTRLELEKQRLDDLARTEPDQIALAEEQVTRLRAIVRAQRSRVSAMHVLAGEAGILQVLPLELGQWVNPGQELARVAQAGKLKAVLQVPEGLAKDVVVGQRTTIDMRGAVMSGHVQRIDPTIQNSTVAVEVALDSAPPAAARADLSVDGTIEEERLVNVLNVARPAVGQPGTAVTLFKLDANGTEATRVSVTLGRASATRAEVRAGLVAGDRVIISDMSAWENVGRIRLR